MKHRFPRRSSSTARTAVLTFAERRVALPAASRYDLQNLVDHVRAAARRHGRVLVDLGHRSWVVTFGSGDADVCCEGHARSPREVVYRSGGATFCERCGKGGLFGNEPAAA